jgi:sRNA-binding carbon storage regulator CsrA
MLCLQRRPEQSIELMSVYGEHLATITIGKIRGGNCVDVLIDAPKHVRILRDDAKCRTTELETATR